MVKAGESCSINILKVVEECESTYILYTSIVYIILNLFFNLSRLYNIFREYFSIIS